jgi:hypothetical protein
MLRNLRLLPHEGECKSRKMLEKLPLEDFDSIMVLADNTTGSIESSDSESMACLLLIRDIIAQRSADRGGTSSDGNRGGALSGGVRPYDGPQIISEILDQRTKALMSKAHISDYVLSNQHMSRVIAMVAQDRSVCEVLTELLTDEGNELYVRPVRYYVSAGEVVGFLDSD